MTAAAWICERVTLDQRFAGKSDDNPLDRFKRLRANGWELEVLIEYRRGRPTGDVIAVGYLPTPRRPRDTRPRGV